MPVVKKIKHYNALTLLAKASLVKLFWALRHGVVAGLMEYRKEGYIAPAAGPKFAWPSRACAASV